MRWLQLALAAAAVGGTSAFQHHGPSGALRLLPRRRPLAARVVLQSESDKDGGVNMAVADEEDFEVSERASGARRATCRP